MNPNRIAWLTPDDPPEAFPPETRALREPDGLLAAGGDLSTGRLLYAYRKGIFPWYDEGQPILWWSPDPRCVLRPGRFHISRRLRRTIRKSSAELVFNQDFAAVVRACAEPRPSEQGTWITPDMIDAYVRLHDEGWAHSVEVRDDGVLTGGLYGIAIGRVFFGESMFSRENNASKFALLGLSRMATGIGISLIDCQVVSPHLLTLGATTMPRDEFSALIADACEPPSKLGNLPQEPVRVAGMA